MRGLALLASFLVLAALAACAEPAGPSYAWVPADAYGPWPEGYYCCAPRLVPVESFHPHHHHHGGGHHH